VYDFTAKTGTAAIPDPAYVALGVPVDDTVGTLQFAPPGGANTVTIATAPGARLTVQSGGSALWVYDADGNGNVTAYIDSGTYDFIAVLTGYTIDPVLDEAISADAAIVMDYTPLNIPAPALPGLCVCYLDMLETFSTVPDALPANSTVKITANPTGATVDYQNEATAIDPAAFVTGRLTISLPRLARVDLRIPGFVRSSFLVPDTAQANLAQFCA
jgi:hypothetical protein